MAGRLRPRRPPPRTRPAAPQWSPRHTRGVPSAEPAVPHQGQGRLHGRAVRPLQAVPHAHRHARWCQHQADPARLSEGLSPLMASQPYTRGWKQLREQAFAVYGRQCRIGLPGCTRVATTIDHIDPVAVHGAALPTLDRVRPACPHCNYSLGARLGNSRRGRGSGATPMPTPSRAWTQAPGGLPPVTGDTEDRV